MCMHRNPPGNLDHHDKYTLKGMLDTNTVSTDRQTSVADRTRPTSVAPGLRQPLMLERPFSTNRAPVRTDQHHTRSSVPGNLLLALLRFLSLTRTFYIVQISDSHE